MIPHRQIDSEQSDPLMAHRAYAAPLHYYESTPVPLRLRAGSMVASLGNALMTIGTIVPTREALVVFLIAGAVVVYAAGKISKLPRVPVNETIHQVIFLFGFLLSAFILFYFGPASLDFGYISFELLPLTWICALNLSYQVFGDLSISRLISAQKL